MYMRTIVHNCRTQHSTEQNILIIFSLILRTIIIAQMTFILFEGRRIWQRTVLALKLVEQTHGEDLMSLRLKFTLNVIIKW